MWPKKKEKDSCSYCGQILTYIASCKKWSCYGSLININPSGRKDQTSYSVGRLLTHQALDRIDGHYFHTWCSSVRPTTRYNVKTKVCQNKIMLQRYMGAGWVTKFARILCLIFFGDIIFSWNGSFVNINHKQARVESETESFAFVLRLGWQSTQWVEY